ncbi:hypothetical protein C0Q70_19728 [Pomacea canaliculata]|uniref:Uncharacterized protein n=1 Tax=Pomacea canaliculata TaxID=400727 RepID=A0A2T7NDM2_POMCA|nr:hypothetical protein C0Q70_19728 [Pomacea canaliculata]
MVLDVTRPASHEHAQTAYSRISIHRQIRVGSTWCILHLVVCFLFCTRHPASAERFAENTDDNTKNTFNNKRRLHAATKSGFDNNNNNNNNTRGTTATLPHAAHPGQRHPRAAVSCAEGAGPPAVWGGPRTGTLGVSTTENDTGQR